MPKHKTKRIGIALGSGAARGWAHIGILQQLEAMNIRPEIICGCSIGAIVGAACAVDNLNTLEKRALSLTKLQMIRYFELNTTFTGFARQEALRDFFHQYVCAKQQSIAGLRKQFAAVATDLHSGEEIWLRDGKVIDAVWASIALPGLFPPFAHQDRWLIDGGLVNAVPVAPCRDMGADIIIAVDLNGTYITEQDQTAKAKQPEQPASNNDTGTTGDGMGNTAKTDERQHSLFANLAGTLKGYSNTLFAGNSQEESNAVPGIIETIAGSIDIMQNSITRYRLQEDKPDIVLSPQVKELSLLEFYRAEEAIQEGRNCVLRMQTELEDLTRTA